MDDRYAAGLFDGEGCIRIARWKKPNSRHVRYQLYMSLGVTHRPVIEALQAKYGGSVNMNRHDLRSKKNRIQFTWNVSSQLGAAFLRRIQKHLIIKLDEVDVALALQDHIDTNPYKQVGPVAMRDDHKKIIAYREKLFQKITVLKKRSWPPLTT